MNKLQNPSFAVDPIEFIGEYGKQTCSYTHATTSLKMFNEDLGKIWVCSKNINHVYSITEKEENWIRKKMANSEQGDKINIKSKDGKIICAFENMIVPKTLHKIKSETHKMVCLGCLHGKKKRVPIEMLFNCVSVEDKVERREKQKKKLRKEKNKKQSNAIRKPKPVLGKSKKKKSVTVVSSVVAKTAIVKNTASKKFEKSEKRLKQNSRRTIISQTEKMGELQKCEKVICTRMEGTCCHYKTKRIHSKTQKMLKECYYNGIVIPCGKMTQEKKQNGRFGDWNIVFVSTLIENLNVLEEVFVSFGILNCVSALSLALRKLKKKIVLGYSVKDEEKKSVFERMMECKRAVSQMNGFYAFIDGNILNKDTRNIVVLNVLKCIYSKYYTLHEEKFKEMIKFLCDSLGFTKRDVNASIFKKKLKVEKIEKFLNDVLETKKLPGIDVRMDVSLQDMKMQDMKMQDVKMQDVKMQDMKMQDVNKMQDMKMQDVKMQDVKLNEDAKQMKFQKPSYSFVSSCKPEMKDNFVDELNNGKRNLIIESDHSSISSASTTSYSSQSNSPTFSNYFFTDAKKSNHENIKNVWGEQTILPMQGSIHMDSLSDTSLSDTLQKKKLKEEIQIKNQQLNTLEREKMLLQGNFAKLQDEYGKLQNDNEALKKEILKMREIVKISMSLG